MPAPALAPLRVHSDTHIFAMIGSETSTGTGRRGTNLNIRHKVPVKTVADFKLRSGRLPIRRMDISDAADFKNDSSVQKANLNQEPNAMAVTLNRNLAPHLLLASLLEELCYIYVKDKNKSQHLFKILCNRLSKLQVMSPLSHVDEMSGLRYQRRTMLNKIIRAAIISMDQGPSLLALPDANFGLNLHGPSVKDKSMIEQQTSRYKNEFQEMGLLGKGGFGSVFKAKNYLDGREYAVKKVRFKHKNADLELKLIREVKALANLQHTNIVGYNAAWMEYDSPYLVGKESSSNESPRTQDSDSDSTDSPPQSSQFDTQDSMNIEFCFTDDKSMVDVKKSLVQPLHSGLGLAISAKLFSTVHTQDDIHLSENFGSGFNGTSHTCLNEKHNTSFELESTHFSKSILEHSNACKTVKNDEEAITLVQKEVNKQLVIRKELSVSSHDTNSFQSKYENQMKGNTVTNSQSLEVLTETHYDTSEKILTINSTKNIHSTKLHNHLYFEGTQGIPSKAMCFNSGDGLSVHSTMDSAGFVSSQESSNTPTSVVDGQINVDHTLQNHSHNLLSLEYPKRLERQKNPNQLPSITLPADFTRLCQQTISSSHFIGLKQDHQDNVSISTSNPVSSAAELASLKMNSFKTDSEPHSLLDTASQPQNQQPDFSQFKSIPSSQFISERETVSSFSKEASNLQFNTILVPDYSCTSKLSTLGLYNNIEAALVQDQQPLADNLMHSSSLLPILSVSQRKETKRQLKPLLKVIMPDVSSSLVTFPRASSSAEPGGKQASLQKTGLQIGRKVKKFAASAVEEVLEFQVDNIVFQNSITLYIQMELCTFTLQEWMSERNLEFHSKGYDDVTMRSDNIRVFHQILQGVDFIHSNGLIHRDLKPRNIFLSGSDLHVKIGDFGLATGDALRPGQEDLVLTPISAVTPLVFDNHTTGVGTSAYASPEQLKGSTYDFKSDVYSLGIMLYEMFHVFNTEMERAQEIQKLRAGNKCCVAFRLKWPLEADTVEALTDSVACQRPSAQDVLSSQLFLSHEQQVKMLQKQLLRQQKEMERMREELIEKDKIIAQLRRDKREMMLADDFDFLFDFVKL